MTNHDTSESQSGLPRVFESVLRAVLLTQAATIPATEEEVASYDERVGSMEASVPEPDRTPSFLFSWERKSDALASNEVVFPSAIAEGLALAARADAPVSDETRTKLSSLIADMRDTQAGGR